MERNQMELLRSLALAGAPATLYALLADHLLPERFGTSEPRTYVLMIVGILVVSVILLCVIRRREERIIRALHRSLDALVAGRYDLKFRVHAGKVGALALSINRLAAELRRLREQQQTETAALHAAIRDAREEMHARSLYLANVSRDLQGPLHGIIELGHMVADEADSQELADLARSIVASGHRLVATLRDLSDFSRIQAGELAIRKKEFDLHLVVKSAIGSFVFLAHEKNLKLKCKIAPSVPHRVVGDGDRVRQVLESFLDNAVKYTHDGEISVMATLDFESTSAAVVRIAVIDTGEGIDEAFCENIFLDPTADHSLGREFAWSGLGLATCRDLAEMMGGEVGVESEPGRGSAFWFTVAVEKLLSERQSPTEALRCPIRDLPLLLISGDPNLSANVILALKSDGFIVRIEESTEGLHDTIQREPCGMVLLDGERPELIATMATWSADGKALQVPVVGVPRRADRSLHAPMLVSMVHEWMGEAEEIAAPV